MNAYLEVCLKPNPFKGPAKFDCHIGNRLVFTGRESQG